MTQERIFKQGTYVGNASTQSIATDGFKPACVMAWSHATAGPASGKGSWFKGASMAGDDYFAVNGGTVLEITANGVTLTSTGFDLGSANESNKSGVTYSYLAIKEGPWIKTFSYTGDGVDPQVFGFGDRKPGFAFVATVDDGVAANERLGFWFDDVAIAVNHVGWDDTGGGDRFHEFTDNAGFIPTPDTNDLEARGAFNTNTKTYHAVVLARHASTRFLRAQFESASSGDSSDVVIKTGSKPELLLIAVDTLAGEVYWKTPSMPGDDAYQWNESEVNAYDAAAGITLDADGFTLDGATWNASSLLRRWIAFLPV